MENTLRNNNLEYNINKIMMINPLFSNNRITNKNKINNRINN